MEDDLLRLDDMVALVTGCTSPIGQVIVEHFSVADATLIETGLNVESLRQDSRQHREQVGDVVAFDCDLMQETDVSSLVEKSLRQFGRIDVLVNNAAFHNGKLVAKQSWSDWLDFARFFVGQMVLTQTICEHMRAKPMEASVIFISSVHQETVRRIHPPYSTFKAATYMSAKELRVENGSSGIRVNTICPGHIESQQGRRITNPYVPLRFESGLPEDVGKLAIVLASRRLTLHLSSSVIHCDVGERLYSEWVARISPSSAP